MVGVMLKDRKRASWIIEKTLTEVIHVQWSEAEHVMHRTDNQWTTRGTERLPRDGLEVEDR